MDRQNLSAKQTVLVAPLDWGLGHATRCIPIINELLQAGCHVIIATSGNTYTLLKTEFPNIIFLPLEGYNIRYATGKWTTILKILFQIPKILKSIRRENRWLNKIIPQYAIAAVIADNRYGLYHKHIYSVFITHQLQIKTPCGRGLEKVIQKINYAFINKFTECWVPDFEGAENLGGALSHPTLLPLIPTYYIGALSRFETAAPQSTTGYLLIVLSGPEPQRSLLEDLLLAQLESYSAPVVFVRGLPGEKTLPPVKDNITIVNHLPLCKMQEAFLNATFIISRCGYSTVMDLITLNKRSILIPTPGQTEQEYLAAHLMSRRLALCFPQSSFYLPTALQAAENFSYTLFKANAAPLKTIINNMVLKLTTINEKN